ncbi:hypothetical protein [Paenibacillus dokdonensis]|uniref:hypothetical protein n=1 Tax=Paenibacillus dokdonensis TaxID=2567944 RepID=UPI0010A77789|nr:hypothetical protein [Paenibacillus dokdonensis]
MNLSKSFFGGGILLSIVGGVDETGIFILHHEALNDSKAEKSLNPMAASWSYTPNDRETGICYNALGGKLFDLYASASFQYNGSDVKVAQSDGDRKQYFFGATLKIDPVNMGTSRFPVIEGYIYAEVYSRLKVDTVLGIKWFGVSIGQSTIEVEIGSTVAGNVYKGVKVV